MSDSFPYVMSQQRLRDFLSLALVLRVPFRYQRYGDGEFACMGGWDQPQNMEHEYSPPLRVALCETMKDPAPKTIFGVGVPGKHWPATKQILDNEHVGELPWVPATVFTEPTEHHMNAPIFEAMKGRPVLLIGPEYLSALPSWLVEIRKHVVVPNRHCVRKCGSILGQASGVLSKMPNDTVVLVVASLPAAYFIHSLGKLAICRHMSFMDMGCSLDPYVGKASRRVHKSHASMYEAAIKQIKELLTT